MGYRLFGFRKNHIIWNMAFRKWAIIRAVKFGRKYNEKLEIKKQKHGNTYQEGIIGF